MAVLIGAVLALLLMNLVYSIITLVGYYRSVRNNPQYGMQGVRIILVSVVGTALLQGTLAWGLIDSLDRLGNFSTLSIIRFSLYGLASLVTLTSFFMLRNLSRPTTTTTGE